MKNLPLWNKLLSKLNTNVTFLSDKPEETAESTLKALWLTASGTPVSAESALTMDIEALDHHGEKTLLDLIEKRISGIPLAHLTERQQFMGIELMAGPEALVPRKETELLGNTALTLLKEMSSTQKPLTLFDVCTGTGNLAVALTVLQPNIRTFATDLSKKAVFLANKNVQFHRLDKKITLKTGDMLDPFNTSKFHNKVDLLLCNPPYISSTKVQTMIEEISNYEPHLAFDGGTFGIRILKKLIQQAPLFLKPNGWLAFEVGLGQGPSMVKVLRKNAAFGEIIEVKNSLGDIRTLCAQKL